MSALLEVEKVSKSFGGVRAVDAMRLSVPRGTIMGVIGPNGSGKTTFLGLLSGTYRPDRGWVTLDGVRLDGLPAHRTVRAGVARTFQTTRLFGEWTLDENLAVASGGQTTDALALLGLDRLAPLRCASLSGSQQRLAMIAVAMATRPKLLLLDEPAVGMSGAETDGLARIIRRLRDAGVTVLIVEHNMHLMMGLADRIVVMNAGRRLAEGTPAEIRADPAVVACYLGS